MAGYTNWTVVIGSADPALEGEVDEFRRTYAADITWVFDSVHHVARFSEGRWKEFTVDDKRQTYFDEQILPLLHAASGAGLYWRCATDARDDFDAAWFDSLGNAGVVDPFADLERDARVTLSGLSHTIDLTQDELGHLVTCLDYRCYNLLNEDADVEAEEGAINDALLTRLASKYHAAENAAIKAAEEAALDELDEALDRVTEAADGCSNDEEIAALTDALNIALARLGHDV